MFRYFTCSPPYLARKIIKSDEKRISFHIKFRWMGRRPKMSKAIQGIVICVNQYTVPIPLANETFSPLVNKNVLKRLLQELGKEIRKEIQQTQSEETINFFKDLDISSDDDYIGCSILDDSDYSSNICIDFND